MPTVRFALALTLGAVWWALGWTLFAWAYNAFVLGAALWELFAAWRLRRFLQGERKVNSVLEIDAPAAVTISVVNPTLFPAFVALKDEPPLDFRWEGGVRHPNQLRPLFAAFVPARSQADLTYTVTPMRRGEFSFGTLYGQVSTPLRLVWLPIKWSLPQTVRVLPNLSMARRFALLMRKIQLREMGLRRVPFHGAGTEFASLRDYLPDDDPRWIDWNATARRGRLVSKEFELERGQNIVAVVDAGRVMATRLNGLTKLDHAVNAAAFVLYLAHLLDDRIGLMVFARQILHWLPPRKGVKQWDAILQALRQVEPQLVEAEYAAAFTRLLQSLPRRSLLVLFTDLIDPDTSDALIRHARLLAEKHLVLVVAVSDYELRLLLEQPVKDAPDLYRQAAAVAVLTDRLKAVGQLRESGVAVLDAAPEHLFSELFTHYLLAKRRL